MEFELNKKYQLKHDKVDHFIDLDSTNKSLVSLLDLEMPFTVLSLDNGSVDKLKTFGGEVFDYNDCDLCNLIGESEAMFFEEVKDNHIRANKVILVMSTDTVSRSSGIVNKEMVADMVKEFLSDNPDGKVEIFELTKTAQVECNIVYK